MTQQGTLAGSGAGMGERATEQGSAAFTDIMKRAKETEENIDGRSKEEKKKESEWAKAERQQ